MIEVESLEAAKAEAEPTLHLVVPRFLPREVLEGVVQDFPRLTEPRNHRISGLEYGPRFQALLEDLAEPAWMDVLGEKLGVPELAQLPFDVTVRGFCEASDGHIHTDHWSKVVTVLIYPNLEWTAEGGRLRILRSPTDLEDYATEVVPVGGTMLAFRRSPTSLHGHLPHVGPRKVIQISWLRRSPLARASQATSRFVTHLAKQLGLHPDH